MKNHEIGERIKIEAGAYEVVKPDKDESMFIARSAQMGFLITSFKMEFVEQEGMVIEEGNGWLVQLAGNTIIRIPYYYL